MALRLVCIWEPCLFYGSIEVMLFIDLLASELLLIWSLIKDLLGLVMASGIMSPPKWDEKMTDFSYGLGK